MTSRCLPGMSPRGVRSSFSPGGVEGIGSGFIEALKQVPVDIENRTNGLMAKAGCNDFGVLSGLDEQGDVAVSEIVETAWLAYGCLDCREPVAAAKVAAAERSAFGGGEH